MTKNKRREESKKRGQNLARRKQTRPLRKVFLIICEGKRTEPNYFSAFRVSKDVCDVIGVGDNTIRLVREAIARKEQGNYTQVWVVMDKDDFPVEHFNSALSLAHSKGISVAYSNEAFELWYLLHFDYHNNAISRSSYKERLSSRLGFEYRKNDPAIYEALEDRQLMAIQNAARLLAEYGDEHKPAYDNPSTTVHLLVMALREEAV
jgi:hypothetical protein